MAYRKLVNFFVFVISILIVNLITDKVTTLLLSYRFAGNSTKATLIGMAVMVFVLYPAYNWLDDLSSKMAKRVFKAGKHAGGKFLGVTVAFLVCLFILFLFYLHLWFGKTIFDLI